MTSQHSEHNRNGEDVAPHECLKGGRVQGRAHGSDECLKGGRVQGPWFWDTLLQANLDLWSGVRHLICKRKRMLLLVRNHRNKMHHITLI